jgi:hypothetical protein
MEFCKEVPPVHEGQPHKRACSGERVRVRTRGSERTCARGHARVYFGPLLDYTCHVWVMFRPCLDNVWTMFGLCLDHVGTMFGPCLGNVWAMFGPYSGHVSAMFGPGGLTYMHLYITSNPPAPACQGPPGCGASSIHSILYFLLSYLATWLYTHRSSI